MDNQRPRDEGGFTFVEMTVVMTLLVFLISVMANLTVTSSETQRYTDRRARAVEVNQELINDMRVDLLATVNLFPAGTMGDGYLAILETDPTAPILGGSRLPQVFTTGVFRKETTSGELTGNVLMFASQAWTTPFTCTSGNRYMVDVYRIRCFYLTEEEGGPQPGSPLGLNLSRFVGEPMADGDQVDGIQDATDQLEVILHLANGTADDNGVSHPETTVLWKRGKELSEPDVLRQIDPGTGALDTNPKAPRPPGQWRILRDVQRSSRGVLYYRHFSVASNHGHRRFGVARFGLKDASGDGFPHGFEVQIGGASSVRQVLLHISIVSTNRKGTAAHSDLRARVFVQDV